MAKAKRAGAGRTGGRKTEAPKGRANQRERTRKALLDAAARLMKQGLSPSLEEVAEAALVSRATAYRYFPTVELLLLEAAIDIGVPKAEDIFSRDAPSDPAQRLRKADAALHRSILANEPQLRLMLAASLKRRLDKGDDPQTPVRQNRRLPLIEAALLPARGQFDPSAWRMLKSALALVIGTESMVVTRDVLGLSDAEAEKVRHWAIEALVKAAKRPRRA